MPSPSPYPTILAFGDSLVAGYGLPADNGFAAVLERRLRARHPQASVINAGVPGDTTDAAAQRLPRLLIRLTTRPDLVIVQVGPNDVLRGMVPAQTRRHLDTILTELARCGIPTLLTTVQPPALFHDRAQGYLDIHDELAMRHGVVTVPFFPVGVLGHRDMVLTDGVHPNGKAIAAVVNAMLPAVERALIGTSVAGNEVTTDR